MSTHRIGRSPSRRGGCISVFSLASLASSLSADPNVIAPSQFVNWESPHVHPMDKTPDGRVLLVVNTADNRLELFDIVSDPIRPQRLASVPVGLDPISVRVLDDHRAWVVNRISDSVSIVDLDRRNVVTTLKTRDEPADVVFAHERALVSCAQDNVVLVFNLNDLDAPPISLRVEGLRPSAMAVSPGGDRVFVAILESGNASTVLNGGNLVFPPEGESLGIPTVVDDPAGPHAGANPPSNLPGGIGFAPPLNPNNTALAASLIVKKDVQGRWRDDVGADWSNFVSGANANASGRKAGWDMPDNDLAIIDPSGPSIVGVARRAMTVGMAVAFNPATNGVVMVGTDAHNEKRFETNLNGRFIDVVSASISVDGHVSSINNLNPQLAVIPPFLVDTTFRLQAIGDPRAIVFDDSGQRGFVAGMGSNNLVPINQFGQRNGEPIRVGEGPTGLVMNSQLPLLYVLNRFEGSISIVSTTAQQQLSSVPLFDPTPAVIKRGRKHLFDTHHSSLTGHVSCASCHIDSRFDRLAWDLGDPRIAIDQNGLHGANLGGGHPSLSPPPGAGIVPFELFSQMKGPMVTQTLQDIIGNEPFHWRGDRAALEDFNGTFTALLGNDQQLSPEEMRQFEDYLATITFPPNPFRNFDNSLPTALSLTGHFSTGQFVNDGGLHRGEPLPVGNAQSGLAFFIGASSCHGAFTCAECHTLPTGKGVDMRFDGVQFQPIAIGPRGEHHRALFGAIDGQTNITLNAPQLRNLYQKVGMNYVTASNFAGFGFNHDGTVDTIERFIGIPFFVGMSDQRVADLTAFLLSFSGSDLPQGSPDNIHQPPGGVSHDTHAAVGRQTTVIDGPSMSATQAQLIQDMSALADTGRVGLVVKGVRDGRQRGWVSIGSGVFQSDHQGETALLADLIGGTSLGQEITFTIVVRGTQIRVGIDHDLDGILDFDDDFDGPNPPPPCPADFNQSGQVTVQDIFDFLQAYFGNISTADFNNSGVISVQDIFDFLAAYFAGCP